MQPAKVFNAMYRQYSLRMVRTGWRCKAHLVHLVYVGCLAQADCGFGSEGPVDEEQKDCWRFAVTLAMRPFSLQCYET